MYPNGPFWQGLGFGVHRLAGDIFPLPAFKNIEKKYKKFVDNIKNPGLP
jgi:hypothetical protein